MSGTNLKEIQEADMLRSTLALEEAWKSDTKYTEDEMLVHLEALLSVVERKSTYADFVFDSDLTKQSFLQ